MAKPDRPTRTAAVAAALLLAAPAAASAEGLGDLIRGGLSRLEEGATAVGRGASAVAGSVNQTMRETNELFSDGDSPAAKRAALDAMAADALTRLFHERPETIALFQQSVGYAVFDTRRLVVAGIAAGGGRGVAVSLRDGARTYMNMGAAGVGMAFGVGGFASQAVIFFRDDWAFSDFLVDGSDVAAEARAAAGQDRTQAGLHFVNGRAVFALTETGWIVSATAMGTHYWIDRELTFAPPAAYPGSR